MSTSLKISRDTAESIGRPIFDKVLRSFHNSDREELIKNFPELQQWMTSELFDETVGVINRLGECNSIEYSTCSIKDDYHVLDWNVGYSLEEEEVCWNLYLSDDQKGIMVKGFTFNR